MLNLESIRKTFVPPIVATLIAIGLVTDWGSSEAAGLDDSTSSQVIVTS
jgi:hypothetical protein